MRQNSEPHKSAFTHKPHRSRIVYTFLKLSRNLIYREGKRGVFIMVTVKKQPGDSDESLIRKFSRKVMSEGIIQEAKRREFYLKPSLARKQKAEEARRAKKTW